MTAAATDSDYIRSFNRFEFKYVVTEQKARELALGLEGYTYSDPYSGPQGYPVYSVYWDSEGLTFFWEKIDGEKYRRKLRFRHYRGTESVFIEIKQRIDRTVQKRRVLWPADRTEALFGNGSIDPLVEAEVEDRTVQEALFLARHYGLKPMMAIGYQRQALFAQNESDLRITFDRRLQYDAHSLDIRRPFESGKYLLDPSLVVVEVKFNNCVPLWLVRLLQRLRFDLVRFSKYCSAVDREFFGGQIS